MKFLVNVIEPTGCKFSDYMLVLCQKLHICTYDRQKFSGDRPTSEITIPPVPPPKVEVLEQLLHAD